MIVIDGRVSIDDNELAFRFARSGGPGGQNVNKVNSKVELRWDVAATRAIDDEVKARLRACAGRRINSKGELVIVCGRSRDQLANRLECLDRLAELARRALRKPKRRVATKPTAASRDRRLVEKQARARRKRLRQRVGPED